ncbi:hypothetical protein EDB86DRAFT_2828822 [Lactarius hatsudake]|nr:hypothetical protein EDB86DRAFT_2828822 [Lactarius hatsudake]
MALPPTTTIPSLAPSTATPSRASSPMEDDEDNPLYKAIGHLHFDLTAHYDDPQKITETVRLFLTSKSTDFPEGIPEALGLHLVVTRSVALSPLTQCEYPRSQAQTRALEGYIPTFSYPLPLGVEHLRLRTHLGPSRPYTLAAPVRRSQLIPPPSSPHSFQPSTFSPSFRSPLVTNSMSNNLPQSTTLARLQPVPRLVIIIKI